MANKPPTGPESRIPRDDHGRTFAAAEPLTVNLPGGGTIPIQSADEKVLWNEWMRRYVDDYKLTKMNDLALLGGILSNLLLMYRAQRDLAQPDKQAKAQAMISAATDDIRKGEKALGIDKATRERGGQHTVADFITRLKRAAYEKGVHVSDRVKAYEAVMMEARWRIRLNRNGDQEDKDYHKVSDKAIVAWLEVELAKLEEKDKTWAKEVGALYVGKL